jgi:hypothetical protein
MPKFQTDSLYRLTGFRFTSQKNLFEENKINKTSDGDTVRLACLAIR